MKSAAMILALNFIYSVYVAERFNLTFHERLELAVATALLVSANIFVSNT